MNNKWLCDKKILGLILSGTAIMAGETVVVLTNSVIAGNMIGEKALAAINYCLPVYTLIGFIAVALSIGTSVRYSYEMGRFNVEGARRVFSQSVIAAVFFGAVIHIGVLLCKGSFLSAVADDPELYAYVEDYLKILIFMSQTYPVTAVMIDAVYSDGGEKICGISYIPMIFGAIVLSIVFCNSMGTAGIALGMICGQIMALMVLCTRFISKKNTIRFRWYINIKDLLATIKYGSADACRLLGMTVMILVVNRVFIMRFGTEMMPTLSVAISLLEFSVIFDGIGQAIMPMIGLYRGEKNTIVIAHIMKTAFKYAIVEGIIITSVFIMFPQLIVGLLGINDPLILGEAENAVRISAAGMIPIALLLLVSSYHLFMDYFKVSLLNVLLKDMIMPATAVIVFSGIFGLNGVWLGFVTGNIATIIIMLIVLLVIRKGNNPILLIDRKAEMNQKVFNIKVTPENVSWLCQQVRAFAEEKACSKDVSNKLQLVIEEVLMITKPVKNEVFAECFVDAAGDKVRMILRDSGEVRKVLDSKADDVNKDLEINPLLKYGLGAHLVQQIASNSEHANEQLAMGINRIGVTFDKHS